MSLSLRPVVAVLLSGAVTLSVACAEPPQKELDRAHGAIDTARAAGAATYAGDELKAAEAALGDADAAVAGRDYRLALDRALDAYARALETARLAVEGRVRARGEAERAVAELEALVGNARWRLKDAPVQRLAPRVLAGPRSAVEHAERALQDARSALGRDDYPAVLAVLQDQAAAVTTAMTSLDEAVAAAPPRRRR